jgi:hypothetical protein
LLFRQYSNLRIPEEPESETTTVLFGASFLLKKALGGFVELVFDVYGQNPT